MRPNHCRPFRGRVAENAPLKVSGRLQGSRPTGVWTLLLAPPGKLEQAPTFGTTPACGPANAPSLSLLNWLGKLLTSLEDTLFGKRCWIRPANSGVIALAEKLLPTPDRSTSTDPKKNNLLRSTGPPIVPFASLRRNVGTFGWKTELRAVR